MCNQYANLSSNESSNVGGLTHVGVTFDVGEWLNHAVFDFEPTDGEGNDSFVFVGVADNGDVGVGLNYFRIDLDLKIKGAFETVGIKDPVQHYFYLLFYNINWVL